MCVRVRTEEYQQLIDDIVRDGRLYSSHQHRQVLKVGPHFAGSLQFSLVLRRVNATGDGDGIVRENVRDTAKKRKKSRLLGF